MQCGIVITAGDPRTAARLAAEAEAAGWDGVFTWDAIAIGPGELWDPWILLAAMGMATERVRLGAMVFAPARRRPWKLAREICTLDHLTGGRLVLPVGLGALEDAGFGSVGEPTAARTRAELLDETLAIIDGLASGEDFGFEGRHYRFSPMTFRPTPVQRPRVPVWVVGSWPHERSMQRAIRWDGIVVQGRTEDGTPTGAPPDLEEITTWIAARRLSEGLTGPFEVVVSASTPADAPEAAAATVRRFEEAGATWWIEADWEQMAGEALRERIAAGPPRA
ncbi:MAG TPA: LLM class flavin-dependent oxidoreductase [Candidatus Limnocylindrales bacterium]|nr:LLM class flavin-dependent oxidoreductase [Candidatus Limnocylindrales bacterium]